MFILTILAGCFNVTKERTVKVFGVVLVLVRQAEYDFRWRIFLVPIMEVSRCNADQTKQLITILYQAIITHGACNRQSIH